jgi:internalin A
MNAYAHHMVSYLFAQSWQIALVAGIVGLLSFALRNRSAHVRYLLWLIVLAKCLVPPFLTIPLAVLPEQPSDSFVGGFSLPEEYSTPMPSVLVGGAAEPQDSKHALPNARETVALVWAAGVFLFLLWVGGRAVRYTTCLHDRRKPLSPALQESIRELAAGFKFRKWPRIWLAEDISQPFVWGLIRGSVYLPADFAGLSASDRQRSILAHELSHVARFDAAINLLQVLAQASYWFHPFVWWANRKIRQEREKCCDETAVAHLNTPPEHYTGAIVDALATECRSAHPVPLLAIVGSVKDIEERIRTMLKPGKKFRKRPTLVAATVVSLIALVTIPTALVLTAKGQSQPPDRSLDEAGTDNGNADQPHFVARTFNSNLSFNVAFQETSTSEPSSIGRTPSPTPLDIPACWLWSVNPRGPVQSWDLLAREIGRNEIPCLRLGNPTTSDMRSLADWTGLQGLDLVGGDIVDASLGHLKGLMSGLQMLGLSYNALVTDAGLEHLKGMTRLQYLDLSYTHVSGLEYLDSLTGLQYLNLSCTPVTDAGLEHLKGLSGLRLLRLAGSRDTNSRITNAGLAHLEGLTGLQGLDLHHTLITNAGLEHLKGLTGLQNLWLFDTGITDAGLEHLKGLTGLHKLFLPSAITDAGLAHLKGLTGLKELGLSGDKITDAGLAHLTGLSGLEELYLSGTRITDAGIAHLKGLGGLQTLTLSGTQITDSGLERLRDLTGLQRLTLANTKITNVGVEYLKDLNGLQLLDLSNTQITDAGLEHLKGLTGLWELDLAETKITDAGIVHLKGLIGLQTLNLSKTKITDAGLEHLKGLTGLQNLWLDGTQITDAGLEHFKGLTELLWLGVSDTQVTDTGEQQLRQSLPRLTR